MVGGITVGIGVMVGPAGVAVAGGGVAVITTVITTGGWVGCGAGVGVDVPQPTIATVNKARVRQKKNIFFIGFLSSSPPVKRPGCRCPGHVLT
jgi:hypothetical protein